MSTDYATLKKISAQELFNGCLEAYGVCEHTDFMFSTDNVRCLTDGRNGLFVYVTDKGCVSSLSRTASCGDPGKILEAIARVFDTDIVPPTADCCDRSGARSSKPLGAQRLEPREPDQLVLWRVPNCAEELQLRSVLASRHQPARRISEALRGRIRN
jgi:hypothetical protein